MAADFATIVGVLADGGVEAIVIGGLAAQAHGSARITQDIAELEALLAERERAR